MNPQNPYTHNPAPFVYTHIPRSSLAFQGLYLGGFTYSAFNSIYFADVLVDPACLASGRPGACVHMGARSQVSGQLMYARNVCVLVLVMVRVRVRVRVWVRVRVRVQQLQDGPCVPIRRLCPARPCANLVSVDRGLFPCALRKLLQIRLATGLPTFCNAQATSVLPQSCRD